MGNLRSITDYTGAVRQRCTNLPFGDGLTCTSAEVTPTHFTGYMRDTETGLDFANARYFTGQFGRFLSPDPLGGSVGSPQSLNRYAYALNNPLNVIDPSGMNNCILLEGGGSSATTCGGPGGGSGGGIGMGGGPFGAGDGGTGGGGSLGLCALFACGFGGGGPGLPGPPTATQLEMEGLFMSAPESGIETNGLSSIVGALKGAANFFIDWDNGLRQRFNSWGAHYDYWTRFEPSNSIEAKMMPVGGALSAVALMRGRGGRYSGRYADGTMAFRTNVPRSPGGEMPLPLPDAQGPHSRIQWDAQTPGRIFSAVEFDQNGNPIQRLDFAARRGQPIPHAHIWNGKIFLPEHVEIVY